VNTVGGPTQDTSTSAAASAAAMTAASADARGAESGDGVAAAVPLSGQAGMRQVARLAGVAMSSVSRVLSGHPDVSAAMRVKVMTAVEQLGYEPNLLAQQLRRGATQTVGFVVGDISNPLLAQITLGAEVALRAAGYALLLTNSVNQADLDASHVRLLQQRRVDGLLLSLADESNAAAALALGRSTIPAVLIDRDLAGADQASAVLSDHAEGIGAAAEHLITLGHRRLALIAGSPHVRPTRERVRALEDTVARHRSVSCQVRAGAFSEVHGEAATRDLLDSRRPPTAIIAGGNQILIGVLRALRAAGRQVPTGVSLVTCDDTPLSEFLEPPLATIRRDPRELGRVSAELLLRRLGGAGPETVVLPTTFAASSSCAAPPGATSTTQEAR